MTLIEISGTPKAGKDTLLRRMKDQAASRGKRLSIIQGGATEASIDKGHESELLHWTIGHVISAFLEKITSELDDHDVLAFNRGFFDRLAWIECYMRRGVLTVPQARNWKELLLSDVFQTQNTILILLVCPPEIAISRDERVSTGISKQRIMNVDFLETLNTAYDSIWQEHRTHFRNAMIIDERCGNLTLDAKWQRIERSLIPWTKGNLS